MTDRYEFTGFFSSPGVIDNRDGFPDPSKSVMSAAIVKITDNHLTGLAQVLIGPFPGNDPDFVKNVEEKLRAAFPAQ